MAARHPQQPTARVDDLPRGSSVPRPLPHRSRPRRRRELDHSTPHRPGPSPTSPTTPSSKTSPSGAPHNPQHRPTFARRGSGPAVSPTSASTRTSRNDAYRSRAQQRTAPSVGRKRSRPTAPTSHGDDYWPVLAARLNLAESAGLPVRRLLASAITQRPLPAENPATALWWRLAPHLAGITSPTDPRRHRIRPTWTDRIAAQLGTDRTDRLVLDRLWPVLVARVDQATSDGIDPAKLVEDAASQLAAHINTLPPHELATVLLWHIGHLADPDPVAPGDDLDPDVPPDPADADLIPPPDMYDETPDPAPAATDRGDQLEDRSAEKHGRHRGWWVEPRTARAKR